MHRDSFSSKPKLQKWQNEILRRIGMFDIKISFSDVEHCNCTKTQPLQTSKKTRLVENLTSLSMCESVNIVFIRYMRRIDMVK